MVVSAERGDKKGGQQKNVSAERGTKAKRPQIGARGTNKTTRPSCKDRSLSKQPLKP